MEIRSFRLTIDTDVPEDLGASSWDFDPSDGGQLLPALADLQRLYPLKRKWASGALWMLSWMSRACVPSGLPNPMYWVFNGNSRQWMSRLVSNEK